MMRIGALDRVVAIDRDAMTATVEAGIPLWRLNDELAKRGLALSNLGDIDRQTIAGATSTGTHGTGLRYGSIAAAIVGLELVTASGDVVRCSATEEPEIFACARVGLGVLGVVTQVTLQCEPLFKLRAIEEPVAVGRVPRRVGRHPRRERPRRLLLVPAHRHVHGEDEQPHRRPDPHPARLQEVEERDLLRQPPARRERGATVGGARRRSPSSRASVVAGFHRTERVDLSYHVFCTTRLVRFVEMEYAIPRAEMANGPARDPRRSSNARASSWTSRSRSAASVPTTSRSAWASGRETCYLAVHLSTGTPFERYFHGVEAIMDGLGGRPHWGKMHFQTAARWRRDIRNGRGSRRSADGSIRTADSRSAFADRVLGTP